MINRGGDRGAEIADGGNLEKGERGRAGGVGCGERRHIFERKKNEF